MPRGREPRDRRRESHVDGQLLVSRGASREYRSSVGGAVSALVADTHLERVVSPLSFEGNFTLDDAFMASRIAAMELGEVEAMLAGYRADVAGWLAVKGIAAGASERARKPTRSNLAGAGSERNGDDDGARMGRPRESSRRFHHVAGDALSQRLACTRLGGGERPELCRDPT